MHTSASEVTCLNAVASTTVCLCDILHGLIPKTIRYHRTWTLGSWPTPVLSNYNPRCTKGEARGRSQKAQLLTYDGDENCRPLQVRQRERHSVYWQIVQPYQQLKCMPSISTSLSCVSRVTSYQHQEWDLGKPWAVLTDLFSEGVQVCLHGTVIPGLWHMGALSLGILEGLPSGQGEPSAAKQRGNLLPWVRHLH